MRNKGSAVFTHSFFVSLARFSFPSLTHTLCPPSAQLMQAAREKHEEIQMLREKSGQLARAAALVEVRDRCSFLSLSSLSSSALRNCAVEPFGGSALYHYAPPLFFWGGKGRAAALVEVRDRCSFLSFLSFLSFCFSFFTLRFVRFGVFYRFSVVPLCSASLSLCSLFSRSSFSVAVLVSHISTP